MIDYIARLLLPEGFSALIRPVILGFKDEGRLDGEAAVSAIRDGIGRGMKRWGRCSGGESCSCPYCQYFKPKAPAGYAGDPSPGYSLELAPLPDSLAQGVTAHGSLMLIGRTIDAEPWFISALLDCGQIGIGVPEASFAVYAVGMPIELDLDLVFQTAQSLAGVSRCRIAFVTPFVLTDKERRLEELSFGRLIRAICERLQPNVGYWCGHWMRNLDRDELIAPLIQQAEAMEWEFRFDRRVAETARKFDGRVDSLTGFTGELAVRGDMSPFWQLLILGMICHIGRYPALDRGRYELWPTVEGEEVRLVLCPEL